MKRACERRTTNGGHQTAGAPAPTKNDEQQLHLHHTAPTSPPPHCHNFTTTTSTKMLTTTTTSYPVSRSTPLLAALNELNPFTVPKSRKSCSFRCINGCHFSVERGEGKNTEETSKGRRRREEGEDKVTGRPARQVAAPCRPAAGRSARGRPTGARPRRQLPPSPSRRGQPNPRPTRARRASCRPATGRLRPLG